MTSLVSAFDPLRTFNVTGKIPPTGKGEAMPIPKRLPYELLILGAVAVGSCDARPFTSADAERLDYAEINLERAAAASRQMVNRVERLERRVDELERELD